MPEAAGWEPNAKQKLGPRVADLGATMDPVRLAEAAADLNVRLMKWRAAPALNIDRLATVRCLLLGAGEFSLIPRTSPSKTDWLVRHCTEREAGATVFLPRLPYVAALGAVQRLEVVV